MRPLFEGSRNKRMAIDLSYGLTTVQCMKCGDKNRMFGFMPMALVIWHSDEGLECCGQQTMIIEQVPQEEIEN